MAKISRTGGPTDQNADEYKLEELPREATPNDSPPSNVVDKPVVKTGQVDDIDEAETSEAETSEAETSEAETSEAETSEEDKSDGTSSSQLETNKKEKSEVTAHVSPSLVRGTESHYQSAPQVNSSVNSTDTVTPKTLKESGGKGTVDSKKTDDKTKTPSPFED